MLMKHGLFKGSYQHTNFRIHPRGEGTKWYLEEIQAVRNGVCTISFDGFDKSRNIEVPEDKNSIGRHYSCLTNVGTSQNKYKGAIK